MLFTLQVVGSQVRYRDRGGEFTFPTHRKAYRYLCGCQARKVAGATRCLSGLYLIVEK